MNQDIVIRQSDLVPRQPGLPVRRQGVEPLEVVEGEIVEVREHLLCGQTHYSLDGEVECCCGDTHSLDGGICCGCGHHHDMDSVCLPVGSCGSFVCCVN